MEYGQSALYYQALVAATASAKAQTPQHEWKRLQAGAELACDGKVVLHADLSATVHSATQAGVLYTVYCRSCSCMDAQQHPERRCKHAWGARLHAIARKASLPLDWQAGMYSVEVRDARADEGSIAARVCTHEYNPQHNGGAYLAKR